MKTLDGKTPFKAWYGKKPNISHLRVFGCSACIHIPKYKRKKLDPKAKKCIFLGYGTSRKGYRLYDWKTWSIVHSRDVIFSELSTGNEGAKEKQHVQVEHFSEEPEAPDLEEDSNKVLPDDDSEEPKEENSTDAPAPRRTSTREIRRPDYYGSHVYAATELQKAPQTVKEALNCSEKEQWEAAMQKEMDSIYNNGVWDLVDLPANRTPVGNKWVFKKKTKADGLIE